MMKKRVITLFLLGALLAGVLLGCGDTRQTEDPGDTSESSSSGEIVPGGEIVVGISQDLGDSLDPYQMTAAGTREVLFNVYEGLVKPDKDGNFIPAVAEALPDVSEDGLQYSFSLRENVKFHNGAAVTVVDVVKSFETCAATTVDSALGAALSAVERVEAMEDGRTVVITLSEPNGDMLSFISSVFIVPADYADQATSPVGTGPFCFISRSVQANVVLEKFADYWGEGAYLDKVTFQIYEDTTARMSALGSGALDMSIHMSSDQVDALGSGTYKSQEGTMNLVQALYLNNAEAPFDNELVRQALCYAIDKDEILAITANGHGTKVGTSIYPAFGKYFDAELAEAYPHDVEKAKQLLEQAGYPDGFEMTISVPNNYSPHVSTAEVVVEQLAEVGITAKLNLVEWATWLSDIYGARQFQSTIVGFDATTLTANALLNRWISDADKNMINYDNADYDAAMEAANAAVDDAERTQLFRDAAKILSDTAANVYIQDLADFVVMKHNLDGFAFYPLYVLDMSSIHFTA